jgi:hypothetical protein
MDLDAYRARTEQCCEQLSLAQWDAHTGRADAGTVLSVYTAYADLFAPAAIRELQENGGPLGLERFAATGHVSLLAGDDLTEAAHAARRLGYDGYRDLCERTLGLNLEGVRVLAEEALDSTQDDYDAALLERGITSRDELRTLRPAPDDDLPGVAAAVLENMPTAVTVDLLERTGKSQRAFTCPVRVPDDIRVSVHPGPADRLALLHELGHAAHLVSIDPELPVEERRLEDPAFGEAAAFVFERRAGAPDALHLLLVRRQAAKLLHELAVHAGPEPDLEAAEHVYVSAMQRATGVQWPAERAAHDIDPFFACADYLRGWAMAQAEA